MCWATSNLTNKKIDDKDTNSKCELLIDQLRVLNPKLASFVDVIVHASEKLTRGNRKGKNDFDHSQTVHQRLSDLLPKANIFGLDEAEIFILIASAYLHDIGYKKKSPHKRHGEKSADIIMKKDEFKYLFPGGDIQNQVASICDYHDKDINDLSNLSENIELDFRSCRCFPNVKMKIRPRMLGAIFRLADELECNSDRMLVGKTKDPRSIISAVRIDVVGRSICLDFKHSSSDIDQKKCFEYLQSINNQLSKILQPYDLAFKIVETLPEDKSVDEEERIPASLNSSYLSKQRTNLDDLMDIYKEQKTIRINSITSILSERGITK